MYKNFWVWLASGDCTSCCGGNGPGWGDKLIAVFNICDILLTEKYKAYHCKNVGRHCEHVKDRLIAIWYQNLLLYKYENWQLEKFWKLDKEHKV